MTDQPTPLLPCPFDKLIKDAKKQKQTNGASPRGNAYWKGQIAALNQAKGIWNTRPAPAVKPLVWAWNGAIWYAKTHLGEYRVSKTNNADNDRYMVTHLTNMLGTRTSDTVGYIDGVEAAKAAAQERYAALVLLQLQGGA